MDLREIEDTLLKLQKVGIATCEACDQQFKFSDIEVFGGSYLCPSCLRKAVWKPEDIVELSS